MKKTEPKKPSVLVVDDDKNTRDGLARALGAKYDVLLAEGGEKALDILRGRRVDILLTDVRMPGMDGLALLQRTMALENAPACVLLTAYGSVDVAVEAMKRGAHDFLTKPLNLDHLELVLQRVRRSQAVESENLNLHEQLDDKYGMENIVGTSPSMHRLYDTIRQAAPTQATVLIEGESGTGKELVAHA
ncbi:MAG: sigma-54-dependent Fis family transcriptional regulator, partial [Lentisphaerae bacterium]|nr:sigma-54-dependent Fis family transcriptional regulator [Lentisphaerota bacterium]